MREYGPVLARFYPGLPDLHQMSPTDVAAYLLEMTKRPEDPDGEEDFDAN